VQRYERSFGEFYIALDQTLRIKTVNEGYTQITGYGIEDIMEGSHTLEQLVVSEDFQMLRSKIVKVLSNGEIQMVEHGIRTKDDVHKVVLNVISLHRENNRLSAVRCMLVEVREVSDPVEKTLDHYKVLAAAEQEHYFEYDVKKKHLVFPDCKQENGESLVIENFTKKIMTSELIQKEDRARVYEAWKLLTPADGIQMIEFRSKLFTQEYEWNRVTCILVAGNNGEPVKLIGRMRNIQAEKEVEQELLEKSTRDSLTGLLNASMMMVMVNQFLGGQQEEQSHALFLIDVKHLKEVNKKMGYFFGDTVLENIATAIREIFPSESIIGRVDGDKFAVLVKNTHALEVSNLAEQTSLAIRSSYVGEDDTLQMASYIGVAVYPFHGTDYKRLYHEASMAVYQLKMEEKSDTWILANEETSLNPDGQGEKTKVQDKTVEMRKVGLYDPELVVFAFDLFSSAVDITSALWVLLDRVGRQYNLDRILIMDSRNSRHVLFPVCEWSRDGKQHNSPFGRKSASTLRESGTHNFIDWKEFVDQGESYGIHAVDRYASLSKEEKTLLGEWDVQSLVVCGSYYKQEFSGCILFMDEKESRNWSGTLKETFFQIAKIITYFLRIRNDKEMSEKRIEKLTNYDRVTGLYNQDHFKEEAGAFLRKMDRAHRYAMVYCDISHFTYINESYGYEQGDDLLYSFARMMAHENPDCVVGSRLFSDCFVLFMQYSDKEQLLAGIHARLERFEKEQKIRYPNADIHVVSGIYLCEKEDTISIAIDNANLARKSIKGNRKAVCQIYRSEMKDTGKKEFIALATLQEAMESRSLCVYLQPKVSLESQEVIGAEALIRWKNPDGSMKYPDDFIPALERTGSIVDLDFYVYEQVLQQQVKWMEQGRTVVPVSINLSRMHGYYHDFAERLLDMNLKYQVPNELIEFEVTESAFAQTEDNLVSRLDMLRNSGFHISMDDFGVGYSSLSMLIEAPIDSVKLDKSFLRHYEDNPERQSLIRYVIEMAHALHKKIIFEGVETVEQAQFLSQCGCEAIQGYLFSRPIPMEEFEKLYLAG